VLFIHHIEKCSNLNISCRPREEHEQKPLLNPVGKGINHHLLDTRTLALHELAHILAQLMVLVNTNGKALANIKAVDIILSLENVARRK
jgi:hypothetical protein